MKAGREAASQSACISRMRSLIAPTVVAAIFSASLAAAQEAPPQARRDTEAAAARDESRRAEVAEIGPAVDVGGSRPSGRDQSAAQGDQSSTAADRSAQTASTAAVTPVTNRSRVLDTLDLGTTSITGNQELPKVLYIVPWKQSDLGDLVGRPVNTLLDEVLAPIDPEVFERHLGYYESLYGESHFGESRNGQSEEE